MAKSKATHPEGGVEKFLVLPIIVLILAQMGTSGDNGALGLANQQLVDVLGATTPDIQLANMVYSLMAGRLHGSGRPGGHHHRLAHQLPPRRGPVRRRASWSWRCRRT